MSCLRTGVRFREYVCDSEEGFCERFVEVARHGGEKHMLQLEQIHNARIRAVFNHFEFLQELMLRMTVLLADERVFCDETLYVFRLDEVIEVEVLCNKVDVDGVEDLDQVEEDEVCAIKRVCAVNAKEFLLLGKVRDFTRVGRVEPDGAV